MKIVLTGATSMIGISLIKKCISEHVYVLALIRKNSIRKNNIPKSKFVKIVECNLNELDLLNIDENNYDVFYHLGWEGTDKENINSSIIQVENIDNSLKAIKLAKKLNCKKFVGAGSQAEYGRKDHIIKPYEEAIPETEYGKAKLSAYKKTNELAKQYNIDHIWCRIFSVYGPNDKEDTLISMLIDKISKNEKIKITKCEQIWDYLYVDDAAECLYKIGNNGKKDKIYNIASGKAEKLFFYVNKIAKIINNNYCVEYGLLPYKSNQLMYLCGDISETIKDINWEPTTSFDDGIKITIENKQTNKQLINN